MGTLDRITDLLNEIEDLERVIDELKAELDKECEEHRRQNKPEVKNPFE